MKYGSEGDKGWDASSQDAQWSGSSATIGGASRDCATHAPWMINGFRISRTSSDSSLDSNSASRTSNRNSRCDRHLRQTNSLLANLLAIYREELAWLAGILREPRCGAVIRDIDRAALPVIVAGAPMDGNLDKRCTLSEPMYDPEGKPLVFLDLTPRDVKHSSLRQKLLHAIVKLQGRASMGISPSYV